MREIISREDIRKGEEGPRGLDATETQEGETWWGLDAFEIVEMRDSGATSDAR
jgi:hypothetical protein